MKKYHYILFLSYFFYTKVFSQEISIKRYFLGMYPKYYAGDQVIGTKVPQLIYFIETHNQDSLVIRQIRGSEKLSKTYSKIFGYSALSTGIGGLGQGYVLLKNVLNKLFHREEDPSLDAINNKSLGIVKVGVTGIIVAFACETAAHIKLRKAIKGYNKTQQTHKVVLDFEPYVQPNASGLTVCLRF